MRMTASLYGIVGAAIINLPHDAIPVLYSVFVIVVILSVHLYELMVIDNKTYRSNKKRSVLKLAGFMVCFLMLNTIYNYPFPSQLSRVFEILALGGFFGALIYYGALKSEKEKSTPPPF